MAGKKIDTNSTIKKDEVNYIDLYKHNININKEELQNASELFPNGIKITFLKSTNNKEKGELEITYLKDLFFSIKEFKKDHPYLVDEKGDNINKRRLGQNGSSYLLLLKSCDVDKIVQSAIDKHNELKKKKQDKIKLIIKKYEGQPLASNNFIKVKVTNPIPTSKIDNYKQFGDIDSCTRIKGIDHLLYKKINFILAAPQKYKMWRSDIKQPKKAKFTINPGETNLAAPTFCILNNYPEPEGTKEVLQYLQEKYPKPIAKRKNETKLDNSTQQSDNKVKEVIDKPNDKVTEPKTQTKEKSKEKENETKQDKEANKTATKDKKPTKTKPTSLKKPKEVKKPTFKTKQTAKKTITKNETPPKESNEGLSNLLKFVQETEEEDSSEQEESKICVCSKNPFTKKKCTNVAEEGSTKCEECE